MSGDPVADRFVEFESVDRCDLCTSPLLHEVDLLAHIVECSECRFRFVSPRPTQRDIKAAYSRSQQYDGWLAEETGRDVMWADRLAVLERFKSRGSLLDVGAGIGTFMAKAAATGRWAVSGTEVSASAVAHAARRHRLTLSVGAVEDVLAPDSVFDAVTIWHVLEHVPSPSKALEAAVAHLAADGVVIAAVPNDSLERRIAARLKRVLTLRFNGSKSPSWYSALKPGDEIHLSHFSPRTLRSLLSSRGLIVQNITVDDHYPRRTFRNRFRLRCACVVLRATGWNFGETILIVGKKNRSVAEQ